MLPYQLVVWSICCILLHVLRDATAVPHSAQQCRPSYFLQRAFQRLVSSVMSFSSNLSSFIVHNCECGVAVCCVYRSPVEDGVPASRGAVRLATAWLQTQSSQQRITIPTWHLKASWAKSIAGSIILIVFTCGRHKMISFLRKCN